MSRDPLDALLERAHWVSGLSVHPDATRVMPAAVSHVEATEFRRQALEVIEQLSGALRAQRQANEEARDRIRWYQLIRAAFYAAIDEPDKLTAEHRAEVGSAIDVILRGKAAVAAQGGLEAQLAALREAAKTCADDREASVRQEYGSPDIHPAEQRRYERDLEPVRAVRALLPEE